MNPDADLVYFREKFIFFCKVQTTRRKYIPVLLIISRQQDGQYVSSGNNLI